MFGFLSISVFQERSELLVEADILHERIDCDISAASSADLFDVNQFCSRYGVGSEKIVLWGDSHAASIARPLVNMLSDRQSLYLIWHNGCPPLVNATYNVIGIEDSPCNYPEYGNKIVNKINSINPDLIVVFARWAMYQNADNEDLFNDTVMINGRSITDIEYNGLISRTIDQFNSKSTIVIIPPQELEKQFNVEPSFLSTEKNVFKEPRMEYHEVMKKPLSDKSALNQFVFDIRALFCGVKCSYYDNNVHYYKDTNHLSDYGANAVASSLWGLFYDKNMLKKEQEE